MTELFRVILAGFGLTVIIGLALSMSKVSKYRLEPNKENSR